MESKKRYDAPPLEEAIFELFPVGSPTDSWTEATLRDVLDALPEFSSNREDLEDLNIVVQVGPGRSVSQGVHPAPKRVRLWNADLTRAIQCGANMCAFNVRRPYGQFEDHLPFVERLFRAYLAALKPDRLITGQRYLNVVKVPKDAEPASFFGIYPKLPKALGAKHRPVAVQVETVPVEGGQALVNLGLQETSLDWASYLIDVYVRSEELAGVSPESVIAWQKMAHIALVDTFELTITDEARKLFTEKP